MEYFNLLDTPVWNYSATLEKDTGATASAKLRIGGQDSRWLIYSIYVRPVKAVSGSFDLDIRFLHTGDNFTPSSLGVYDILADAETISYGGGSKYLQYPNSPDVVGGGSHLNTHPPAKSMFLVPNGDLLEFNIDSGFATGDQLNIVIKAFTRFKKPDITILTPFGNYIYTEEHNYIR